MDLSEEEKKNEYLSAVKKGMILMSKQQARTLLRSFFFLNPRCLSFLVKQKTKTVRTLVFFLARSVSSLFPLLFLHVKCVLKYVLSSFLIVATPLCYPLYICIHLCLCVIVLPLLVQTISLPEKVKRREVRGSLHLLVTH